MRNLIRFILAVTLTCAGALPSAAQEIDENKWGKNTKGVELATHEDPRQHTASGTMLTINIIGKGFPAGQPYDLWAWVLGRKPQKITSGASFDKRGVLICSSKPGYCPGKGPDDPINIQTTAVKGEPKRFGVVSHDGKIAAFTEAVPFPLEATDKKCKLTVVQQAPFADAVSVNASGFTPYELLSVTTQLGGKDSTHSPSAAADGTWQALMGIKTPGQTSGTATIKVAGKACSVSVKFPWGEGSGKKE